MQVVRPEAQPARREVAGGRLDGGDHLRVPLVGDVDGADLAHAVLQLVVDLLVGDDEQVASRHREAGVRVADALPRQEADRRRSRPVGDVEDHHPRVVVAEVGAVAVDHRVVRGVALVLGPGALLRLVLSRPPPAAGLLRVGRVLEVDDDPDPVGEARGDGGEVRVAPPHPHDAVDAAVARRPPADPLRVERVGEVVDREPLRPGVAAAEELVVDEQQAVGDLHLVGVRPLGRAPLADHAGRGDVAHVEDRRPHAARSEVADVQRVTVPLDLHAVPEAVEVVVPDEPEPVALRWPSHAAPPRAASSCWIVVLRRAARCVSRSPPRAGRRASRRPVAGRWCDGCCTSGCRPRPGRTRRGRRARWRCGRRGRRG